MGRAARPLEVALTVDSSGELSWTYGEARYASKRAEAERMFAEGLKAAEVQEELSLPRSSAFRWQKAWREEKGRKG